MKKSTTECFIQKSNPKPISKYNPEPKHHTPNPFQNPEPHSNSKSKLFSHVKIDPGLAGVLEEGGANADADNAEIDGAIDACFILAVCCC